VKNGKKPWIVGQLRAMIGKQRLEVDAERKLAIACPANSRLRYAICRLTT